MNEPIDDLNAPKTVRKRRTSFYFTNALAYEVYTDPVTEEWKTSGEGTEGVASVVKADGETIVVMLRNVAYMRERLLDVPVRTPKKKEGASADL